MQLLGKIINEEGVRTNPENIEAIQKLSNTVSVKKICSFPEKTNYYRIFIFWFAGILEPFHLTSSKKRTFGWDEEQNGAFERFKKSFKPPPVLAFPDFGSPCAVETDASSITPAGVVAQNKENWKIHHVEYVSRTMMDSKRR